MVVGEQRAHYVMIQFVWRPGPAADPIEQIGVGAFEQCLVAVELGGVETGEVGLGETAEYQVALPRPAMPGPEQQPLAADLQR